MVSVLRRINVVILIIILIKMGINYNLKNAKGLKMKCYYTLFSLYIK